ncbi:hypothetical protein [Paenibacillus sp. sgz500958]|uniref:hypothetical protein n=1 Tax=Paenibacillus sp. sgz500958 TaxID=3242475 RepID=UPI0036D380C9
MIDSRLEIQPQAVSAGLIPVKDEAVRRWRVGTLSMGLSLLFLGALIMTSQWKGADVFETALAWWPLIFIMLGLEVVIYSLWFKGKAKMYYDVLSIFFVGFLSVCCLMFAAISSLGLTQEFRSMVSSEIQDYPLPEWNGTVPQGVKQVIVQGNDPYGVTVDQNGGTELSVFGTYRTSQALEASEEDQLLRTKRSGDKLYILLGDPPESFLEHARYGLKVTVSAPAQVKVIVRDSNGNLVEP